MPCTTATFADHTTTPTTYFTRTVCWAGDGDDTYRPPTGDEGPAASGGSIYPSGFGLDPSGSGTVVLPDADLKVFLVADQQVRAQRRAAEDAERGHGGDVADTAAALAERDSADASRATSPLVQAADAVVVDGTYDDLAAVIDKVVDLVVAAAG